jgi:hypothetical protein
MIHYGMTKTAQLVVSSKLAKLTHGTKVTVHSVLPEPPIPMALNICSIV